MRLSHIPGSKVYYVRVETSDGPKHAGPYSSRAAAKAQKARLEDFFRRTRTRPARVVAYALTEVDE